MGTKIIETGSTAGSIAKVEYKDELGNVLFSFDDSNSVLGNILTTSGAAGKLLKTGTAGNIGVGIGATEVSGYLIKSYSPSSASLQKFSNSATGQTATDGWDIGIDSSGTAEIRQRENLPINEYTNNTLRRTITGGGYHVFNGSSAPRSYMFGSMIPRVQIEGTDLPSSSLAITRNSADAAASCLFLGKSRGTTYNSFGHVS